MAFRYTPAENRYVGSITDLMGRGNEAEAQALIKVANAQAQAAQARGQAWGGAIKGIGDTASQAITAWNTPEARLQREMDEAKRIQESGNKELRNVLVPDILGARPGQEVPVTPPVGLTAIQGANLFSGAPAEPRVGTTVSFDGDSTGEAQLDQLQSQSLGGDNTAWYNPKVVPPLQDFGKQGTGSSPSEIGMRQGGPRRPPFSLPDSNNLMQGFEDRASGGAIGQRPQLDREGNPVTRGRYTKDNGQYDIERLYGDLIKSGVSTEVANKFAMQGVESNTIFLTGADLAKKYEESQLQSAGAVARMALSAIDDLGMKPEDALKEAIAGGGAIPEELIRQFRIDFHGKNPEEQRAILEDLVRRSSFLGETTTVGAGDSVIGEGGEVLFEGTPKPETILYDATLSDGTLIQGASRSINPEGGISYIGPNGEPLSGVKSVEQQRYNPLGNFGRGSANFIPDGNEVDYVNFDEDTKNMLQHAGLTYSEFLVLTGRTSSLARGAGRTRAISGANKWLAEKGNVDPTVMTALWKAENEVLEFNVKKFNFVKNAEGEIYEDIQNLKSVVKRLGLDPLVVLNQIYLWGQGQTSDPKANEYMFYVNQLQNDITLYNQASQGGGVQAPTDALRNEAKQLISSGASEGTLDGLLNGLTRSIAGMAVVNRGAENRARKSMWELFGVGDNYSDMAPTGPDPRPDYVPLGGQGNASVDDTSLIESLVAP